MALHIESRCVGLRVEEESDVLKSKGYGPPDPNSCKTTGGEGGGKKKKQVEGHIEEQLNNYLELALVWGSVTMKYSTDQYQPRRDETT